MKAFQHALLFLLSTTRTTADLMIGDQVCITGFIMDIFCIERGTLLDKSSVTTMENPELHSYHCLLDVGVCINSGYQVLGDKDPISGLHCPGLRIDETDRVLSAGRAHGTTQSDPDFFSCDTCTGPDGNPIAGYRATIVGTVKELGDGMGRVTGAPGARSVVETPVLTNVQVLDSTVSCDPNTMLTVEADVLGNECLIRSAAAVAVGDADGSATTPLVMDDTSSTLDLELEPAPVEVESTSLKVGDEICTTGFIMDTLCINRGTLLDSPSVVSLLNPDLHSYHCLLDVDQCINSGYQVLGEKDPNTGEYCLGYRLEETDTVVAAGRAHGGTTKSDPNFFPCETCTGPESNPIAGYRATVKGTIKELGDGTQSVSGQPLLTNIQMLDASVECATPAPQTVCLVSPDGDGAAPAPDTPSAGEESPSADCSSVFCKTTLTDGYTLRYKLNELEGTVSMEATYDGEAWLGIAFSEDERMGGSNGILGSPGSGIPQKYRLSQGFIEIMTPEEQTLTDASVVVNENGQTVMKFTKPLVEPDQITITGGVNNMLWANGGDSNVIGYHGQNRAPVTINLSSSSGAAEELELEPAPVEVESTSLKVGDEICTTGFIMDTFCINRGTLLDSPSVVTLANPDLHSYHCLLDVDLCINSGYQVLGEKDPSTGEYCLGYRLEETDTVVAAGRAHGGTTKSDPNFFQCETCTGPESNPIAGYRATVKGTIKELGDGTQSVSGQPLLTNIQMLDASVECATPAPQTVCLVSPDGDGAALAPGTPSAGEESPSADCSSVFCKTTLTDGYTLRYKLNEPEGTVSMEATYDGEAWLGIAFSEDERMGGSNGILGSPDSGIPQKYRLSQGFIEIMTPEEQTLTDASVVVNENGQTVMKFTKPLVEQDQIAITDGVNNMLWANGGDSNVIGYHGQNRAPVTINLSSGAAEDLELEPSPVESTSLKVGDEICTTGFIMDTFCINRGTLLDSPSVVTLANPDLHSYHCLLDVDLCINSGYQVLGEKDPSTGDYCLGYRLEETDTVVAAGRAHGGTTKSDPNFFQCETCTGPESNPIAGYRATVKGTIKELGDGTQSVSGQPLLTNIQMLDASVECATPAPQTVCLVSPDGDGAAPAPGTPSAGEESPSADCSSVFCKTTLTDGYTLRYKLNEPEGTVSMEATYDGEAWLGIAFSEDERMGGSNGILGSPDSGIPQKYRLLQGDIEIMTPEEQTLTDASVVVNENGQTVMKFTKPLVEPDQIAITGGVNNMLWANGGDSNVIGYHGQNRAPVIINLSSGAAEAVRAPNMGAWLAHGICAFIAWGVLAPTAVNAALYRSLFKGPLWFKLHQFFNASAYALTIIAFAIAVAFINKEGNPHWFSSHAKMGLSMFIIASVQVLWGAARPHLPGPDTGDEKTTIRKVWEIKHRLTGTILLASGIWQMSAGIKLFAIKYSGVGSVEEQGVTIAYWVWIGAEVALLLIGSVYFRLLKKPVEDEGGNDAANAVDDKQKQQEDAV